MLIRNFKNSKEELQFSVQNTEKLVEDTQDIIKIRKIRGGKLAEE